MSLKDQVVSMVALFAFSVPTLLAGQTSSPALAGTEVVEMVNPSVALVLFGESGSSQGYATAVVVRPDGVLLTSYHAVKNAREVQVRLKNGEVFDRVELIAFDDRRDVAALRIAATGLPAVPIGSLSDARAGLPVYVISHAAGLTWSASAGIVSGVRMAEDIPGAGSGYRVVQFTAPISPGSSGGVLVDAQGRALGIVVGVLTGGQNINFAIPVESVVGLTAVAGGKAFASGARLQLPSASAVAIQRGDAGRSPAVPPAASPDLPPPDQLLIRTVSVLSKTIYIRRERLQDDLRNCPLFRQLGVRFADYGETADVAITVDRPFLTFDWTYTLVHQLSGLALASGMIEGVDEFDAGPKLAAEITEQLAAAAVLPRGALVPRTALAAGDVEAPRRSPSDPAELLRAVRTIFVESHTIWMKGNLLQDALYVRPEIREWGIRISDDRSTADVYIDVTRPFLTYDWVYKMVNTRTGTEVGRGKVVAIDGPAAAQRLAIEIVKRIQSARPLPATEAR